MIKCIRIQVFGHVHGVGFRRNAKKQATVLGLKGYVKNLHDGSVFIEAEGIQNHLNIFIKWCWEGPTNADVKDLIIEEKDTVGYQFFDVRF